MVETIDEIEKPISAPIRLAKSKRFGYIRVEEKVDEDYLALQIKKLTKHDVLKKNIRVEYGPFRKNLPILNKLLNLELQKNDILILLKLSHFCNSIIHFLKIQEKIHSLGTILIVLDLPFPEDLDFNSKLMMSLSAMSKLESDLRLKKQLEGIKLSKNQGKKNGRPSIITDKLVAQVNSLKNEGETIVNISKSTGYSRTTIYKILR